MAPATMPAMAPVDVAARSAALGRSPGGVAAAVPGGAAGLVVEEPGAVAVKATTWYAEGTSSRPSPTLGVGKWLASAPMDACCRTLPVEDAGVWFGGDYNLLELAEDESIPLLEPAAGRPAAERGRDSRTPRPATRDAPRE